MTLVGRLKLRPMSSQWVQVVSVATSSRSSPSRTQGAPGQYKITRSVGRAPLMNGVGDDDRQQSYT